MPAMELSKGLSLPHSFAECEGDEEESAVGNLQQGGSSTKRVSECKRVLITEKLLEFGFKLDVDSDEGKVQQVIDGIDEGQVDFYKVSSDSMSKTSSVDSSVPACLYVLDTESLMVPDSFDGLKPLFEDNEGVPPASPSVNFLKMLDKHECHNTNLCLGNAPDQLLNKNDVPIKNVSLHAPTTDVIDNWALDVHIQEGTELSRGGDNEWKKAASFSLEEER